MQTMVFFSSNAFCYSKWVYSRGKIFRTLLTYNHIQFKFEWNLRYLHHICSMYNAFSAFKRYLLFCGIKFTFIWSYSWDTWNFLWHSVIFNRHSKTYWIMDYLCYIYICLYQICKNLTNICFEVSPGGFTALIVAIKQLHWPECVRVWSHLANKTTCAQAFEVCACACVYIVPFVRRLHTKYASLLCLCNKCGQTHVVCQRNHNHKSGSPNLKYSPKCFWAAQWKFEWFRRANSRILSFVRYANGYHMCCVSTMKTMCHPNHLC